MPKESKKETDDKFMLVSLEDEKSKHVAEVLASKTCKRIIGYLAETKEASQKDISDALKIPMNTMDYNMKKLIASGFAQKRKNFFWSKKGKKIVMYEISHKSIIISPRKSSSSADKIKSLLPAFMITAAGTFASWVYEKITLSNSLEVARNAGETLVKSAGTVSVSSVPSFVAPVVSQTASPEAVSNATQVITTTSSLGTLGLFAVPLWLWFLLGGLLGIAIISIVNWKKL